MNNLKSFDDWKIGSTTYRGFRKVAASRNLEAIIGFYDRHKDEIEALRDDEAFEIHWVAAESLYMMGHYEECISSSHKLAENCLKERWHVRGIDNPLTFLLIQLANCYQKTGNEEGSRKLCEQVLKIEPQNKKVRGVLRKYYKAQLQPVRRRVRPTAILGFLLTAAIIAVELLIVRPFLGKFTTEVELSRNILFLGTLVVLGASELYLDYLAGIRTRTTIDRVIARAQKTE